MYCAFDFISICCYVSLILTHILKELMYACMGVCVCVCVCVCMCDTLQSDRGRSHQMGTVPTLRVSAIDCKSNVEYIDFTNDENLCAPVTSPVIGELSYILIHKASPIACCTS